MSIPRTSLQSKSSRLALAVTGAAVTVAVLVSGGVAAAGSGPAPSYRIAAAGGSPALRIQPVTGPQSSQPAQLAAGQARVAGQATAAGRQPATGQQTASQHQPSRPRKAAPQKAAPGKAAPRKAVRRKAVRRLSQLFGGRLAAATRGAADHRSGQHTTQAHRAHPARAHARHAPARHQVCANSRLHWWICHAERVLERHGTARGQLSTGAAYIVVGHESGGNPHAYNGWDINAAQGHPSEGIAQVIGPTFHAYALRGYGNIWNPVDNMIAAFRYAISRYGSMNNIPGVVAVRHGGSYIGY